MSRSIPDDALALDRLPQDAPLAACSLGLRRMAHLSAFFGGRPIVSQFDPAAAGAVGWGAKLSGRLARALARARGVPHVLVEDGFIRSVGLGKSGAPAVSLVVDDLGVYYDARRPSRLERLIGAAPRRPVDPIAAQALALWRSARLSKYNLGDDATLSAARGKLVLVDQVAGDASIRGAGADGAAFARMLAAALAGRAAADIVLRTHPDVAAGKAKGHLAEAARAAGVAVLADSAGPHALLDAAAELWTVSSALGFEAVLRGVPVVTFGTPFYAGWGLTEDRADDPVARGARVRRVARPTVEQLFEAAFLRYARYADPVARRPLDAPGAMARLIDWRDRDRDRTGDILCFDFSRWKRPAAVAFLGGSRARLVFRAKATPAMLASARAAAPAARRAAVWGMREAPGFLEACAAAGLELQRVEDGFLRSVGLGSDLRAPGSLVVDGAHLYYDARGPSRLETILATTRFDAALLARAAALRARIVAAALTKYNLGSAAVDLRAAARGRRVVLVVEQVPGDMAILHGGGAVEGNLGLLRAVRAAEPDAFLVYKEHPDLVAGNRRGRLTDAQRALADLTIASGDMQALYAQIDALHAQSSLAGFEALMRGVRVTAWGRPFWAGWGLTEDRMDFPRRGRRLTLDELVAGALILYPAYVDPVSLVPCPVEDFLDSLADLRRAGPPRPQGFLARQGGRLLRLARLG